MPRIARVCAAGYPHHITQRGNNKEKVFFDDEDRRLYLDILQRYKNKYGIKILAYCLMGNHPCSAGAGNGVSQSHGRDKPRLHPTCKSQISQEWKAMAEPILFVRCGGGALPLGSHEIHGTESSQGKTCQEGGRVSMVKRKSACVRGGRRCTFEGEWD